MNTKHWWDDIEAVHKEEGDGQSLMWTYARRVSGDTSGKAWEYAIVTYSDDGEFRSAVVLTGGKAKVL